MRNTTGSSQPTALQAEDTQQANRAVQAEINLLAMQIEEALAILQGPSVVEKATALRLAAFYHAGFRGYQHASDFILKELDNALKTLAIQVAPTFDTEQQTALAYIVELYVAASVNQNSTQINSFLASFSTHYGAWIPTLQAKTEHMKRLIPDIASRVNTAFHACKGDLAALNAQLDNLFKQALIEKLQATHQLDATQATSLFALAQAKNMDLGTAYEEATVLASIATTLITSIHAPFDEVLEKINTRYAHLDPRTTSSSAATVVKSEFDQLLAQSKTYHQALGGHFKTVFEHVFKQLLNINNFSILERVLANEVETHQRLRLEVTPKPVPTTALNWYGEVNTALRGGHVPNPAKSARCYKDATSPAARELYSLYQDPSKVRDPNKKGLVDGVVQALRSKFSV